MLKRISAILICSLGFYNLFVIESAKATTVTTYEYAYAEAALNTTGSPQSYTVPAGITGLLIEARGGDGAGTNPSTIVCGGSGALVNSTIKVSPGDILTLYVGKGGFPGTGSNVASLGGWGYGTGGRGDGYAAGGGGGATAVLLNGTPLIVAGGGGGAAREVLKTGGNAGNSDGSGGSGNQSSANGGSSGVEGTGGNGGATSWEFGGNGGSYPTHGGRTTSIGGGGGGGGYGGGAAGSLGFGGGGGGSMAIGSDTTFSAAPYGALISASPCINGIGNDGNQRYGAPGYIKIMLVTTAPDAPTIGTASALSPTSASISFTAPANYGGAIIETFTVTATSSLNSISVESPASIATGSITITGLTPSTSYTFTVTASNSVGTSLPSSASASLTMAASDEEIAEQAAQAAAVREAAARAAVAAAAAQREAEKKSARAEIATKFKSSEKLTIESFQQADITGVTSENFEALQSEILALPEDIRGDMTQVLKVVRKYEVVGIIASERISSIYSNSLIEIGLISSESKFKATLTSAIKKLPANERSSYAAVQLAIDTKMAEIQARKDRLAALIARGAARSAAKEN